MLVWEHLDYVAAGHEAASAGSRTGPSRVVRCNVVRSSYGWQAREVKAEQSRF